MLAELIAGDEWGSTAVTERMLPVVPPVPAPPALVRREQRTPVGPADVRAVFAAAGLVVDRFEERSEQVQMAEAVRTSLR